MMRDRAGASAVTFAIGLFPIMLAVGGAVDYGASNKMTVELSSALDAATLSTAIAKNNGQLTNNSDHAVTAQVRKSLQAGLGPAWAGGAMVVSASADSTGAITSNASMPMQTKFMRFVGIGAMTLRAQSKVTAPAGPVEVAMVLDTTGSMAGAKIAALQTAANTLTDTLFSVPNAATNVKVGVVPITYYVNIGLANRGASWLSGSTDYSVPRSGCWDTYPNAVYSNPVTVNGTCYSDGAPYACSWTNYQTIDYGAPVQQCGSWTDTYTWYGCVGSRAYPADMQDTANSSNQVPALLNYGCLTPLQRLTSNKAQVQATINGLTAGGETFLAPGLLWGWRVLSPSTPFADGAAYNGRTRKYLVVMTDGFNTHSPNYPDHENTDTTAANSLTMQTCAAIKAKGITVYTVAFQVTDPAIKTILQNCATSAAGYYDSASAADLQQAFVAIGNSISSVRLVQ